MTNISQGQEPFAGVWSIVTPFGTTAVSSLQLTAVPVTASPVVEDAANSDFSFVRLATIPEPATLGLLGVGLLGLGTMLRRRSA